MTRPTASWWRALRLRLPRGKRSIAGGAALALLVATALRALAPMLSDWSTFGFHDWDVMTAYRYITVLSIKDYGQAPWWHPWLCGGYPAFGHFEGATNLVSPYLPVYLLTEIQHAIRIEVLGSVAVGLAGTYLLAGQFTRSVALRTLLAVAFALNGRWALQTATGHGWHLRYAWLPWVLYFFGRAQQPGKLHHAVLAGAILALMVFMGGIYPVPQTALALALYAPLLAAFERSWRPLVALSVTGVTSIGFASPKLLAIIDTMTRAPRLIESTETIGIAELLVMLTDPDQAYGWFPVRVPAYGWHEWGIYVGPAVVAGLGLGILFGRGPREHALKIVGLSYLFLGLGAFHRNAPWSLLHQLPGFASQHVPSRFHYPMILLLGLVFVAWAGRYLDRHLVRRPWLDVALLVPVACIALDIARVSSRPIAQAFWMRPPEMIARAAQFEHVTHAPVNYQRRDWAPPMLLSMMANTGVIKCYGIDPEFAGIGAQAKDAPGYPGPAYVAEGTGHAEVVDWSPNRAVVRVSDASPGALVVYNMNYDPSWRADGRPALDHRHAVAARAEGGNQSIEFSYFPRTLKWSSPLFVLTIGLCLGVPLWRRRRASRRRTPDREGEVATAEHRPADVAIQSDADRVTSSGPDPVGNPPPDRIPDK